MPDNWRSVEIKHLRALGAIADTGTFWAASEQLNSSLSTVSDHITALEALIGERLIERSRGRRTVELTEAGRVLLGHAEAIEPPPQGPAESPAWAATSDCGLVANDAKAWATWCACFGAVAVAERPVVVEPRWCERVSAPASTTAPTTTP